MSVCTAMPIDSPPEPENESSSASTRLREVVAALTAVGLRHREPEEPELAHAPEDGVRERRLLPLLGVRRELFDHEAVDRLAQLLVLVAEDEVAARSGVVGLENCHGGTLCAAVRVTTQMSLVRYDVADHVATIALDQPEKRNALSDALLDDLIAAFERARDDDDVRAVVLTSTHEKVFSAGGDLAGFSADAPLIHKYFATDRFPRLFQPDRRARQADPVRRQRPRARGRARRRAGLRPDRRQGGRALRHARDQRRDLPVHDHGADLPQRRAQEDQRAAAAGRADRRARGRADRDRQQGRARRRVRRGGRTTGRRGWRPSRRC